MEQRVIKFRAFVRGYMVNVVSIDFINQYITWDDNQYDRCVPPNKCYEMESFEEIKLMQYTGLKDKNGKEIYEGDIIQFKRYNTFRRYWNQVEEIPKIAAEIEEQKKEISILKEPVRFYKDCYTIGFSIPLRSVIDNTYTDRGDNSHGEWHEVSFDFEVVGNIYELSPIKEH